VGELDFSRPDEQDASPEDITVDSVHIHRNYRPPKYYNDIAILKLSRHAEYSRYVRPVCLPEPNKRMTYIGTHAVLTGWGYLSFGKYETFIVIVLSDLVQWSPNFFDHKPLISKNKYHPPPIYIFVGIYL
jgi:hypothetical protein